MKVCLEPASKKSPHFEDQHPPTSPSNGHIEVPSRELQFYWALLSALPQSASARKEQYYHLIRQSTDRFIDSVGEGVEEETSFAV